MNLDEQNYRAFLEGDNCGFENLVVAYKDSLIFFIMRYISDVHLAEDLAQDSFVEILVYKERYKLGTNFKTYLFTIGHNKAVDYIRKNNKVTIGLMESGADEIFDEEPLKHIIREENRIAVIEAMRKLKTDYQAAIYLVDYNELTYHEAGKVLNKTLPQMKILLFRARKALKEQLGKDGYDHENQ